MALPLSIIEHRIFKIILHPEVTKALPNSATTLSRTLANSVNSVRKNVKSYIEVSLITFLYIFCDDTRYLKKMQTLHGCVHISLDGWTSKTGYGFQGYVLHGLDINNETDPLVTITLCLEP